MQELYPIIRRQRRPLVVIDAPPVVAVNIEPVRVNHKEAQPAQVTVEITSPTKPQEETD